MKYDKKLFELSQEVYSKSKNTTDKEIKQKQKELLKIFLKRFKKELINNEITKRVKDYSKNKSDLNTYYNVGKLLSEAGKHYGEGIIKEYSKRLTNELGKGYSERNLKYMRKFYIFQKRQPVVAQLTWSHYIELLPIKNINEINLSNALI